jgi:hypothetical protein
MKAKKSVSIILLVSVLSLIAAGCVSPMGMTSSTTPLEGKKMKVLGRATGYSNWSGAILGLWDVNRVDINRAIAAALTLENNVTLVRERDRKELRLDKGAVLLLEGSRPVDYAGAAMKRSKDNNLFDFTGDMTLTLEAGELVLAEKEKRSVLKPYDIIRSGSGLELQYMPARGDGGPVLKKVGGDMLAYFSGDLQRPADSLSIDEGFTMAKLGGDALINVRWYERTYYFVFFSLHRVVVEGDVVRFVRPGEKGDDAALEDNARQDEAAASKKSGAGKNIKETKRVIDRTEKK